LSLIVESAAKRRVVELSGSSTPPKSCTPATSRILLLESDSAFAFVVNVVPFVFRVTPVSDKAFSSTNVVPGRETTEPVEVPPDFNVIVPPE